MLLSLFKHHLDIDGEHEGEVYQSIDLMPIKQDKLIVKFFRMISI